MSSLPEISAPRIAEFEIGGTSASTGVKRFEFARDTFAFANELVWEYAFDRATGTTRFSQRKPKPEYTHRCFVVTRAARQFFEHARFIENEPEVDVEAYRRLIREVLRRDPRKACESGREIIFPGFAGLRAFSAAHEHLLKAECGGAWRSYAMRSHWRMVFPMPRRKQVEVAAQLADSIAKRGSAVIHLFRFPTLTINHGMMVFNMAETAGGPAFEAYDPNDTTKSIWLTFDPKAETFSMPANRYWPGGKLDVLEIYRTWLL